MPLLKRIVLHVLKPHVPNAMDFAKAIAELSPGREPELVKPTDHYPTAAARPLFSVMNTQKAMSVSSSIMKHWRDSLEEVIIKDV